MPEQETFAFNIQYLLHLIWAIGTRNVQVIHTYTDH